MDQQRLRELIVLQLGDQVLRLIELTAQIESLQQQLAEQKASAETKG